jgi:hypothetical protein
MVDFRDDKLQVQHWRDTHSIVLVRVHWFLWRRGWMRQRRVLCRLRYWWGS